MIVKISGDFAWEISRNFGWTESNIDDFQIIKHSNIIKMLQKIQNYLIKRADLVIVPSKYLKRMVGGWGQQAS